jgi:REP element-mobilizing transposase RayT
MDNPHGKNLRKGRYSQQGQIYLLTFATAQRIAWFTDWRLGRLVVASMRRAQAQGQAETLAYVLMPDHAHWLISLAHADLAGLMRDLKSHSGYHAKQRLLQQGQAPPKQIWQEGYHDHALRSEESLADTARYIIMNPVRAGLVKSVRDYPLWDAKWL